MRHPVEEITPREYDVRAGLTLFIDFETTRRPFVRLDHSPESSPSQHLRACSTETLRYSEFQRAARVY